MKDFNWQLFSWWMWCILAWIVIVFIIFGEYKYALYFGMLTIFLLVVLIAWGFIFSYKDKKALDELFEKELRK